MAVHVVGVEREEAVDAGVDLAAQAVLDALAHHRALLARDGQHVGFFVGQDGLAEGDVQVLPRPVGVARLRRCAARGASTPRLLRELLGLVLPAPARGFGAVGRHAAVDGERQADQRVAEQQALHVRQRQHAFDAAVGFGVQEVRVVAEDLAQDLLPAGAVEEGGLGQAMTKASQRRAAAASCTDRRLDGRHGRSGMQRQLAIAGAARSRKMWSMRPQLEVAQQAAQAAFHAVDVQVVAEARLAVDAGDARLVGVDLPGVEVEDRRLPVVARSPAAASSATRA